MQQVVKSNVPQPHITTNKLTRICKVCRHYLTLDYFKMSGTKDSTTCVVCRSDIAERKPWTPQQTARLKAAAKGALDLWPRYLDFLDESDRIKLRELLRAVDRLPNFGDETDDA